MPKRKRDDKDSLESIKKKIKKLERKLLKGERRRHRISTSSDSTQFSCEPQDDTMMESENVDDYSNETFNEPGPSTSALSVSSILALDSNEPTQESSVQPVGDQPAPVPIEDHQVQELDAEILEILGSDPSNDTVYGNDIQNDLAVRLGFIATSGLTKERRKELLESHLTPANCKLIGAPSLNPEIKAAVNEITIKRDKAMHSKQKQICSAIACLSEAITILLNKETKDPTVLKLLMDTGRILCDSQYNESVTRRNFIMAVLKKDLKDQMQQTKIDSLLFGEQLADTIKTAKAINKSGAELKSTPTNKGFSNKPKPPPSNKQLNWKAPGPSRRPTGPPKAKTSAPPTRQQQAPSSRASRPNNSRGRR